MKKKIASISFLLLIVAFLTISVQPFAASASEVDKADTEAGIGFNTNEDEPTLPSTNPSEEPKPEPKTEPEEPTQPSNVRTPSVTNVRSQSRIYRRLPQTNMQQQFLLSLAGMLLVALILIVVTHRDRKRVEANE
ncbi:LPXTG cell wall anchor domain-containing protein [Enterococcus hulanensis]|uniref:LPXTG cell wall anchor domain-containing protein n=1 Tax=Enterococcus hulanensis TaxID=2559929 RepID=A0ABU3EYH5_9ENTE|nr:MULTISPECIES: LPXTG cell wall anchor domain-containing protein [Enterococcus]MDT2599922.1 LPXTG cell wall anchor domain-containing protein [Enterococcus hulanensis]MDT2609996.1 LPXTG cell wall anchor domain-containing protein [Enterococcus hulanensis]MDT2617803.1 LPXTG cell wall anchor domain-containing protein [Enterococcus hulanensis]MDT2630627.1 LPXTG cell wall anchor domain-containing protein [Enterococcus hulanensis]MDT2656368.1 LPXTG cell wall anchor domain-containing protein [Enteroc